MSEMVPPTCVAVIDDDESLCRSLARLLRMVGIRSISYLSAEGYLADASRPHFDCLLLDVQLGGLSGIELSERLAACGCTTPVIFITAHDEPEIHERALRTGCAAYLKKNDPGEVLVAAISRAVDSSK